MIKVVHPFVTSKIGLALHLRIEFLKGVIPLPEVLLTRSNIVTVEKLVGFGHPNQKTDVKLVRFMLNLLAASDTTWAKRFGNKPLPHLATFDGEVERRIRMYQQAGGFRMPFPRRREGPNGRTLSSRSAVRDNLPPLPPVPPGPLPPLPPPNPNPVPIPEIPPTFDLIQEPLVIDGIIDPCREQSDRGSNSKLVYTIVHLNYNLLVMLGGAIDMRLAPILMKNINRVKDPNLRDLNDELEVVERNDPDRPIPRPPLLRPFPIPPGPGPVIVI